MNSNFINKLICPSTNSDLLLHNNFLFSNKGNNKYVIENQIVRLRKNKENIITEEVRKFYMNDPFPNYNSYDDIDNFIDEKKNNSYLQSLLDIIKPNYDVLEFGCGTGQLGNYLSAVSYANIICADLSFNSLKMANDFKEKNNLKGINFIETDILEPCFKEKTFDVIICSGVLHHTINPYQGFLNLIKYLKEDGHIIIGLYNKISRLKNSFTKLLYYIIGNSSFDIFDPIYKKKDFLSKKSWLNDQYFHPLEKRYSFRELHEWFDNNDIDFINSMPSYEKKIKFNEKSKKGDKLDQLNLQIIDLFENTEGGLFIFLGKKTKKLHI